MANNFNFGDLYERAGTTLFAESVKAGLDASQLVVAGRVANDAIDLVYSGEHMAPNWKDGRLELRRYVWSWLYPEGTIVLWPTTTGTATGTYPASVGTITATAAAFYPSMVGHTITFDVTENEYSIIGYTSSTVVTVSTDPTADVAAAFTITPDGRYTLPDAFGGMIRRPAMHPDSGVYMLDPRDLDWIRGRKAFTNDATGTPAHMAVVAKAFVNTTGTRWWLLVTPTPDSILTYYYQYAVYQAPFVVTTDDAKFPYGGPQMRPVYIAAVGRMCEIEKGETTGPWHKAFDRRMRTAVLMDCENMPGKLGPLRNPDQVGLLHPIRSPVAYSP